MSNDETEKEKRIRMIKEELDIIVKNMHIYVQEYLEEDEFEKEAIEAITIAINELAYRKKYYDVHKDEVIYFPSVARLIMKNDAQHEAEKHYWEEEDEFPLEYSKGLKTVVKEQGLYKEQQENNNDDDGEEEDMDNIAYMEKLAQDVEI